MDVAHPTDESSGALIVEGQAQRELKTLFPRTGEGGGLTFVVGEVLADSPELGCGDIFAVVGGEKFAA